MSDQNLSRARWRTSSYSGGDATQCVEVAALDTDRVIATRDSKNPAGPVLAFSRAGWGAFVTGIKHGDFDLG